MPFQVSHSFKATPVGVINFFSAGNDQNNFCDTSVTLTAIVVGDLDGHTVLWEQVTGPAVTFTSPLNQLIVTYTVATFEDRSFRFYIDKDTGEEQSDDVNIFGAPTFSAYLGGPDSNCNINFGSPIRCDRIDLKILDAFPLDGGGAVECDTSSQPKLFWEPPCQEDLIVQYIVQERSVAGAWTDEAFLPPTIVNYTPLNIGSTYRVITVKREINSATSQISSNTLWVDGTIGKTINNTPDVAASESYLSGGPAGPQSMVLPTYTVSLVTLLNCPPDDFDDSYGGSAAGPQSMNFPTFTVDILSLITCDPETTPEHYLGAPAGAQTMAFPTFSVLDLTGIDIGG